MGETAARVKQPPSPSSILAFTRDAAFARIAKECLPNSAYSLKQRSNLTVKRPV